MEWICGKFSWWRDSLCAMCSDGCYMVCIHIQNLVCFYFLSKIYCNNILLCTNNRYQNLKLYSCYLSKCLSDLSNMAGDAALLPSSGNKPPYILLACRTGVIVLAFFRRVRASVKCETRTTGGARKNNAYANHYFTSGN